MAAVTEANILPYLPWNEATSLPTWSKYGWVLPHPKEECMHACRQTNSLLYVQITKYISDPKQGISMGVLDVGRYIRCGDLVSLIFT